jgi:hypothetical protein
VLLWDAYQSLQCGVTSESCASPRKTVNMATCPGKMALGQPSLPRFQERTRLRMCISNGVELQMPINAHWLSPQRLRTAGNSGK